MQIEWRYKSNNVGCMLRHVYSYGLFVLNYLNRFELWMFVVFVFVFVDYHSKRPKCFHRRIILHYSMSHLTYSRAIGHTPPVHAHRIRFYKYACGRCGPKFWESEMNKQLSYSKMLEIIFIQKSTCGTCTEHNTNIIETKSI